MAETPSETMQPRGPGGVWGHIFRMIVMVCTAGFVYPNAFTEGMDPTALQRRSEGKLYEK
jgi:hypothetical protein